MPSPTVKVWGFFIAAKYITMLRQLLLFISLVWSSHLRQRCCQLFYVIGNKGFIFLYSVIFLHAYKLGFSKTSASGRGISRASSNSRFFTHYFGIVHIVFPQRGFYSARFNYDCSIVFKRYLHALGFANNCAMWVLNISQIVAAINTVKILPSAVLSSESFLLYFHRKCSLCRHKYCYHSYLGMLCGIGSVLPDNKIHTHIGKNVNFVAEIGFTAFLVQRVSMSLWQHFYQDWLSTGYLSPFPSLITAFSSRIFTIVARHRWRLSLQQQAFFYRQHRERLY